MRGRRWGPRFLASGLAGYRHLVPLRFPSGSDLAAFPGLMPPFKFRPESLLIPNLSGLSGRTLPVWGNRDRDVEVLAGIGHLFPFEDAVGRARLIAKWPSRTTGGLRAGRPSSTPQGVLDGS